MAVVRVCAGGCAPWVRQGRSAQRPGRSFLSTPAREGASVGAPAAGVRPPPGLVPSLNIVKKSGGGLLNLHCGCGIVRSTLERSRGLRLLPGPLWGLLGPPVTPGPSGASWGLRLLPGPSGASWGLRLLLGPFHSLLNRYGGGAGLCGWVRPGVRQGRSAQRPGRSFLSTPAREGRASAPPRRACDRPWACPFSQHRENRVGVS